MSEKEIHESEDGDRYEAWAMRGGLKFSKVVHKLPLWGFPYDYKQKAHDEIRQAIIAHATPPR